MTGRIIKQISNDYTVLSDSMQYVCKARGKFRNMKVSPLVGDIVEFDSENNYILKIEKRKNELVRPQVANTDQAILITSVKDPDFSTNLLDKLLTVIEYNSIKPVIIFTKMDLLKEEEKEQIESYIAYYKKIGYACFYNTEIDAIKNIFKDKISVFTGQSGAGKSTLLNHLDLDLQIKTAEISKALGRGKHTTRHTELLSMLGGMVADTPGFSSMDLTTIPAPAIRDSFADFNLYRDMCKYKDCMHDKEDDCCIKEKVKEGSILPSRYENYLKFIHERKY
ncbi:MAG: ribosome small subunit-dependent GTPase A [Bacilli bacterium]|nr:ribosome small subunit-dependent GTPase A [Bacilli bacterium]